MPLRNIARQLHAASHDIDVGNITTAAYTLGQSPTLKILVFLAKSKHQYFCLFFCTHLTVLGVLVGPAGE
jgi:hypothetical protein